MIIRKIEECGFVLIERVFSSVFPELKTRDGSVPSCSASMAGEDVYAAFCGGAAVGFVSVWAPEHFIHFLMVDRGFRRKGVGSALLDYVSGLYGQPVRLKCLKHNAEALEFYRSRGFKVVGEGECPDGGYLLLESPGTSA